MTKSEAAAEAVRRWGERGRIEVDGSRVRVGILRTSGFEVLGEGANYAAAFRDADGRTFAGRP